MDNNQFNWDGIDRRAEREDRRQQQIYPPQHNQDFMNMFQQMMMMQQQQLAMSQKQNSVKQEDAGITKSTLTLEQLGKSIPFIIGLAGVLISAWYNMTGEIDRQKTSFEQFKVQIQKDIETVQSNVKELKMSNEQLKLENKKTNDEISSRINELDTTVTQIYQKLSSPK